MNKNGRGMNLVISLLLIVLLVFWFSGILRSMEDTCTQAEFNQMLDTGEISGAVVVQNREVPTGSVEASYLGRRKGAGGIGCQSGAGGAGNGRSQDDREGCARR